MTWSISLREVSRSLRGLRTSYGEGLVIATDDGPPVRLRPQPT